MRALRDIADADVLARVVDAFAPAYRAALVTHMLSRLGVAPRVDDENLRLVQAIEQALIGSGAGIDHFFFDWRGGDLRKSSSAYGDAAFDAFRDAIAAFEPAAPVSHAYWSDAAPCAMLIEEVEAIWTPIAAADDWSLFDEKVRAIRRMGAALAG